jgi:Uma2 family endonuclease
MVLSTTKSQLSLAEFLQLPETKPASEYIQGEIYQKPMAQGEHSIIQGSLVTAINQIGKPQKLVCAFPELRCTFGGSTIVPDITVFEWARIPKNEKGRIANRFEIAPDWVIEILSPEQSASRVIKKIALALNHGTKLGWFIDSGDECVTIFAPNCTPVVKSGEENLTMLTVLADWQFSVNDLFECLYLT